jgi:phosphatidylethanolamine-binding protein (PEBP) family uncharacterized protein
VKLRLFASIATLSCAALAHTHPPDEFDAASSRVWTNTRTGEQIEGSFLFVRSGKVAITTPSGALETVALADLAGADRTEADARIASIRAINDARVEQAVAGAKPVQAGIFDAFAPFVKTRFDERWLYVESDGLPHAPLEMQMMVGITAWQQQVPLPQPYTGTNAWQIPLKPELAEKPISGRTALMRGAVALAANGIPIFNALNNRGADSFAIGELDEFGGHCGRGDDYHYHAAPLAILKIVGKGKPIAYALDGFPIYGLFDPKAKEGDDLACPCGSHEPLDELNGHFCEVPKGEGFGGGTRSYHYHASKSYPYINGGLRGKVEIEGSGTDTQVVPQPRANGVRPALQQLRGAKITGFEQTGPKAWSLRYDVGGKVSFVNYRVEDTGKTTFEFVGPDGEKRVEEHTARARGQEGGQRGGGQRGGRGQGGQGGREGEGGGGAPRGGERPRREAPATSGFSITCAGLGEDGMLRARHTCDGDSIMPGFAWSNLPKDTKSLALTIHHITPDGAERVYLVLYGIPSDANALAEAERKVGRFGVNNVNRRAEYAPPCSQGPGGKTYIATLYALSAEPKLEAADGVTRDALLNAMKSITLGTASIDLKYARQEGATQPQRGGGGGEGQGQRRGGGRRGQPTDGAPAGQDRPQEIQRQGERPQGEGRGENRGQGQGGGGGVDGDRGLLERMTAFKTEVPATDFDAILAQPTATSITVSVRASSDRLGAIEFTHEGSATSEMTSKVEMKAGKPASFTLTGLAANTSYTYRFVSWAKDGDEPKRGDERRLHTPRAAGSAFAFVIQADSHLDQGVTPKVYEQTLANMVAAKPDFLVDLGDTFMTDKRGQDYERALPQYDAQRHYFGLACHSMPLFMVLGNHDGEKGDAGRGIAEWSYNERTSRFPAPVIDGAMFTGATAMKDGRGANYYAFEWGDALVVVLDPFWSTTERSRGGGGGARGGGARGGGPNVEKLEPVDSSWSRTLGRAQYDWLAETLAKSKAKQKFVFIHHLVGGIGGQAARGGVESARYFEWGGDNADGSDGFAAKRPGWAMPIHDLLVKYGVTAVFHGHDHLYVHSTLDGIHYQCVPQPGNLAGNTRSAEEYGYASGTLHGSPGHLRVSMAADGTAKVEFVRTAVSDADAAGGGGRRGGQGAKPEANGAIVDSYDIKPRAQAAEKK